MTTLNFEAVPAPEVLPLNPSLKRDAAAAVRTDVVCAREGHRRLDEVDSVIDVFDSRRDVPLAIGRNTSGAQQKAAAVASTERKCVGVLQRKI